MKKFILIAQLLIVVTSALAYPADFNGYTPLHRIALGIYEYANAKSVKKAVKKCARDGVPLLAVVKSKRISLFNGDKGLIAREIAERDLDALKMNLLLFYIINTPSRDILDVQMALEKDVHVMKYQAFLDTYDAILTTPNHKR